ncbi:hypothetical protein ACLBYD_19740 [Rhodococcus sp. C26F]
MGTDVGDGEGITDGDRVVVGDDGDPGRVVLGYLQKFRVVGCIEVENIEVALGERGTHEPGNIRRPDDNEWGHRADAGHRAGAGNEV